jgi:tRNA-dihydrouridine synthase B
MKQSAGFWSQLDRPIIGLSPMDGVTDHPFRHIQKKYGQPAVVYTEFTSVEGVCHGADRLLSDFLFDETQRPVVAQIYGTTPESFRQTAILLCELGFDGIDINMGCPAKNVAHSGAGAALIKTPDLAISIIASVKEGIHQWQQGSIDHPKHLPDITPEIWSEVQKRHQQLPIQYQQKRELPVSIKTRVGYDTVVIQDWVKILLEQEPATIAIHGRTLKQQYGGQANWDHIAEAAAVAKGTETLILGNGDVKNRTEALEKIAQYNLDGVLIGRGSMGNPFAFLPPEELRPKSTFEIAVEHTQLYEETFKESVKYHFLPMRKHLGWYVKDIPYASQVRIDLFQTHSSQEVAEVLQKHQLLAM